MGQAIAGFVVIGLFLTMLYGWVMNIINLVGLEVFELSGKVIVSIIGVPVFPIGAIMGLFVW